VTYWTDKRLLSLYARVDAVFFPNNKKTCLQPVQLCDFATVNQVVRKSTCMQFFSYFSTHLQIENKLGKKLLRIVC